MIDDTGSEIQDKKPSTHINYLVSGIYPVSSIQYLVSCILHLVSRIPYPASTSSPPLPLPQRIDMLCMMLPMPGIHAQQEPKRHFFLMLGVKHRTIPLFPAEVF